MGKGNVIGGLDDGMGDGNVVSGFGRWEGEWKHDFWGYTVGRRTAT